MCGLTRKTSPQCCGVVVGVNRSLLEPPDEHFSRQSNSHKKRLFVNLTTTLQTSAVPPVQRSASQEKCCYHLRSCHKQYNPAVSNIMSIWRCIAHHTHTQRRNDVRTNNIVNIFNLKHCAHDVELTSAKHEIHAMILSQCTHVGDA